MKTVVAGAIGECVHVAGVSNFLRLAEQVGWRVVFLGPAVPIHDMLAVAKREKADLVGVSYRLTPENGERLLGEFAEEADELKSSGVKFAFGGTPPVVDKVRKLAFFDQCFDGMETIEEVVSFLKGQAPTELKEENVPQSLLDRVRWKAPFPIIRHHFGLPTMQATLEGIEQISDSGLVDVISLGIDQEAQENFFHPERQQKRRKGAGGVPVRSPEDYRSLYAASRRGNFPLMRTYSGTDDFLRLAEMYVETIRIAWAAVPLFWFNRIDGRGPWDLEGSIREHQKLMAWYGARDIPVEANEAHHWGMRDAHDVVFVAAAYLAAYSAKASGVKNHIVQMMFNSPPGTSAAMDIAKMLAVMEVIAPLKSPDFRILKQTRTGLLSYPVDPVQARAHLANTVVSQMALAPDIVHVVGYPEADHAVTGPEVVESCTMAIRAIRYANQDQLDLSSLENVQQRVRELVREAGLLIAAVRELGAGVSADPLADPAVLASAVHAGLLNAPQLLSEAGRMPKISTRIDPRGACVAVDATNGNAISEQQRITEIVARRKR